VPWSAFHLRRGFLDEERTGDSGSDSEDQDDDDPNSDDDTELERVVENHLSVAESTTEDPIMQELNHLTELTDQNYLHHISVTKDYFKEPIQLDEDQNGTQRQLLKYTVDQSKIVVFEKQIYTEGKWLKTNCTCTEKYYDLNTIEVIDAEIMRSNRMRYGTLYIRIKVCNFSNKRC